MGARCPKNDLKLTEEMEWPGWNDDARGMKGGKVEDGTNRNTRKSQTDPRRRFCGCRKRTEEQPLGQRESNEQDEQRRLGKLSGRPGPKGTVDSKTEERWTVARLCRGGEEVVHGWYDARPVGKNGPGFRGRLEPLLYFGSGTRRGGTGKSMPYL